MEYRVTNAEPSRLLMSLIDGRTCHRDVYSSLDLNLTKTKTLKNLTVDYVGRFFFQQIVTTVRILV